MIIYPLQVIEFTDNCINDGKLPTSKEPIH